MISQCKALPKIGVSHQAGILLQKFDAVRETGFSWQKLDFRFSCWISLKKKLVFDTLKLPTPTKVPFTIDRALRSVKRNAKFPDTNFFERRGERLPAYTTATTVTTAQHHHAVKPKIKLFSHLSESDRCEIFSYFRRASFRVCVLAPTQASSVLGPLRARSLVQPATLGRMQVEDTLWQFPRPARPRVEPTP